MTGGHEVAGSSPVAPIFQPLVSKALAGGLCFYPTFLKAGLVLYLSFYVRNHLKIPKLEQILKVWPELPEHIKAAINALIKTNKDNPQ